jgi:4,5-DOPA dioxygenase extradiol
VFAGGVRTDIDRPATPESTAFRDWFARATPAEGHAKPPTGTLLRLPCRQAPHAVLMHPTDEHLLPFYVAAGAAGRVPARRIHHSLTFGDLGMDAYAFGAEGARLAAALS